MKNRCPIIYAFLASLFLIHGSQHSYCSTTDTDQAILNKIWPGYGPGSRSISLKEEADKVVIKIKNPHLRRTSSYKEFYTFWDFTRELFGFGPSKKTKRKMEQARKRRDEAVAPPYLIEVSEDGKEVTFKTALGSLNYALRLKGAPVAKDYRGATISKSEYVFTVTLPKEYKDQENVNFASTESAKFSTD